MCEFSKELFLPIHFGNSRKKIDDIQFKYEDCKYHIVISLSPKYGSGTHFFQSLTIQNSHKDRDVTIFNPELKRPDQSSLRDYGKVGEFIFLLCAKYRYDLEKGIEEDKAGFLHTKQIAHFDNNRIAIRKSIFRTISTFLRTARTREESGERRLCDRIFHEQKQLWHLICWVGTSRTGSDDDQLWWINIPPDSVEFVNEQGKVRGQDLLTCLNVIFSPVKPLTKQETKDFCLTLDELRSIASRPPLSQGKETATLCATHAAEQERTSHAGSHKRIEDALAGIPIHAASSDPNFVGRRGELNLLNRAWESQHIHFVSIVAWGGFGKSVLVRQWLDELYSSKTNRIPKKLLWWSFYVDMKVEAFLETTLSCLGPKTYRLREIRRIDEGFDILLSLLEENPSILVLDGFEAVQFSEDGDYFGKCANYQLANFIRRIREGACPSCLCIATSRLPLTENDPFENKSCLSLDLEKSSLSPEDSRSLLKAHGVVGTDEHLGEIVREHGGHPLALTTIATLLRRFYQGNAEKSREMPPVAIPNSVIGNRFKLWRTFSWYHKLLGGKERHILRIISLFRHIVPWKFLLSVVHTANAAKAVMSQLPTSEIELKAITSHLDELRLIRYNEEPDTFSMHPLQKAFFEHSISDIDAKYYHHRLFELMQNEAPYQPDTLREMWPLIESVYHGCKSGNTKGAIRVFRERIERKKGYLTKVLGAWGTKADLCSMFYTGRYFSGPCYLDNREEQGHLLNAAGYAYMNLGSPRKALPLYEKAVEAFQTCSEKTDEGQVHRNRADALLRIGDLECAVDAATQTLELDSDSSSQQAGLAYLGYAHSLLGSFDLAETAFRRALEIFGDDWLPPIRGVQYVEMLVMTGLYADACDKIARMLDDPNTNNMLYGKAECIRVLGIASCEIACASKDQQEAQKALSYLEKALNYASNAGVHFYYLRTLLDSIRASLILAINGLTKIDRPHLDDIDKSIDEVSRTSKESSYGLIEVEAVFAKACLHLLRHERDRSREECRTAEQLSQTLKYRHLHDKCIQLQQYIM